MSKKAMKSMSDWERVRSESAADAPIPHEPGDGPYNPNDAKAVDRYLAPASAARRSSPSRKQFCYASRRKP